MTSELLSVCQNLIEEFEQDMQTDIAKMLKQRGYQVTNVGGDVEIFFLHTVKLDATQADIART